jgi:methylated-DNA-[protein]-cysteine S-methyltransferase
MIFYCEYASPLGVLQLVASEHGMRGIYFDEHRHFKGKGGDWRHEPAHACLTQTARQLQEYFAGTRMEFDVPLDLQGTPFQQSVWKELQAIPYGSTISYAQQAQRLGKPLATRAVGAANGRNPVSIIVPCHRVVGAGGAVTGYAGGLERKRALLALEARVPSLFEDGERTPITGMSRLN